MIVNILTHAIAIGYLHVGNCGVPALPRCTMITRDKCGEAEAFAKKHSIPWFVLLNYKWLLDEALAGVMCLVWTGLGRRPLFKNK